MNFQIFDPFKMVKANDKVMSPGYLGEIRDFAAVAVGLGLRAVGDA
jgi:hypothetical protein